jgi:hypothetical protein
MTTRAAARERQAASAADRRRAFELNDAQYDFVYDDAHKYTAYIGGIGAGKSFAGAVKALRCAVDMPGSLGVIGAPNYPQLRDSTMRTVFDTFPPALVASINKNERLLTLTNGSEVLFKSMSDEDSLRGPNLAWFWLDEGPLCGYYAWQIMKGRLRQQGYLTATRGWITGTPHGQDEFYEDFEHEAKPEHALYRASTRANARHLPAGFIEGLGYTGNFALQEVEGLFVAFSGLVYQFRSEWHIGEWARLRPDGTTIRPALRIGGVDWGRTNPAVALPCYVGDDGRAYVLDEYYQRDAGFLGGAASVGDGGLSKAVADFTREYGIETWYCGPDEPEHIASLNALFGRLSLKARAVAATDDINPGIETVSGLMALRDDGAAGLVVSAKCAQTRAEFRTYSYPSHSDGDKRDPAEKPVKRFDHAMDALRYGLHSSVGGRNRNRALSGQQFAQVNPTVQPRERVSEIGGVRVLRKTF